MDRNSGEKDKINTLNLNNLQHRTNIDQSDIQKNQSPKGESFNSIKMTCSDLEYSRVPFHFQDPPFPQNISGENGKSTICQENLLQRRLSSEELKRNYDGQNECQFFNNEHNNGIIIDMGKEYDVMNFESFGSVEYDFQTGSDGSYNRNNQLNAFSNKTENLNLPTDKEEKRRDYKEIFDSEINKKESKCSGVEYLNEAYDESEHSDSEYSTKLPLNLQHSSKSYQNIECQNSSKSSANNFTTECSQNFTTQISESNNSPPTHNNLESSSQLPQYQNNKNIKTENFPPNSDQIKNNLKNPQSDQKSPEIIKRVSFNLEKNILHEISKYPLIILEDTAEQNIEILIIPKQESHLTNISERTINFNIIKNMFDQGISNEVIEKKEIENIFPKLDENPFIKNDKRFDSQFKY